MTDYTGQEIYFDASFIGLVGRLRATITEDGDVTGEYPDHIKLKGIYTNDREIWMNKLVLTHKNTKFITEDKK